MAESAIAVQRIEGAEPPRYSVVVREGSGQTRHVVTLHPADLRRFGSGADAERLIEASFRFLLDREPKESILRSFDLAVISGYFPDYAAALPTYLKAG